MKNIPVMRITWLISSSWPDQFPEPLLCQVSPFICNLSKILGHIMSIIVVVNSVKLEIFHNVTEWCA